MLVVLVVIVAGVHTCVVVCVRSIRSSTYDIWLEYTLILIHNTQSAHTKLSIEVLKYIEKYYSTTHIIVSY